MKEHDPHGYFSDGKKRSHTRLLVILTVPALVLIPLFLAAYISFSKLEPMRIDPTVPLYIAAANGIILGYAAHSKNRETAETKTP